MTGTEQDRADRRGRLGQSRARGDPARRLGARTAFPARRSSTASMASRPGTSPLRRSRKAPLRLRPAAYQPGQHLPARADPFAEFRLCAGIIARDVLLGQRGLADRSGVVVKAYQRIELVLACRVRRRVPFRHRPHSASCPRPAARRTGPASTSAGRDARPRRAPADGPRLPAGARIRIGLDLAVGSQFRAAFETLDQRKALRADRAGGRRRGREAWASWTLPPPSELPR